MAEAPPATNAAIRNPNGLPSGDIRTNLPPSPDNPAAPPNPADQLPDILRAASQANQNGTQVDADAVLRRLISGAPAVPGEQRFTVSQIQHNRQLAHDAIAAATSHKEMMEAQRTLDYWDNILIGGKAVPDEPKLEDLTNVGDGKTPKKKEKTSQPPKPREITPKQQDELEAARFQFPGLKDADIWKMLHGDTLYPTGVIGRNPKLSRWSNAEKPAPGEQPAASKEIDYLAPIRPILEKLRTATATNSKGEQEVALIDKHVKLTPQEVPQLRKAINEAIAALRSLNPNMKILHILLDTYHSMGANRPEVAKFFGNEVVLDNSVGRPFLSNTPEGLKIAVPQGVYELWQAEKILTSGQIEAVFSQVEAESTRATEEAKVKQEAAEKAKKEEEQAAATLPKKGLQAKVENAVGVVKQRVSRKKAEQAEPKVVVPAEIVKITPSAREIGESLERNLRAVQNNVNKYKRRETEAPPAAEAKPAVDFLTPVQSVLTKLKVANITNQAGQQELAILGKNVQLTNQEITSLRQQIEAARKALNENNPNVSIVYSLIDYYRNQLIKVRPEVAQYFGKEIIIDNSAEKPFFIDTPDGPRIAVPAEVHRLWQADQNLRGPIEKVLQQAEQQAQVRDEAQAAAAKKPSIRGRIGNLVGAVVGRKTSPQAVTPETTFPSGVVGLRIEEDLKVIQEGVNKNRGASAPAEAAPATPADLITDITDKLSGSTGDNLRYSATTDQLEQIFGVKPTITPGGMVIDKGILKTEEAGDIHFSATYRNRPIGFGLQIVGQPVLDLKGMKQRLGASEIRDGISHLDQEVSKRLENIIKQKLGNQEWKVSNIKIAANGVALDFQKSSG